MTETKKFKVKALGQEQHSFYLPISKVDIASLSYKLLELVKCVG